MNKELSVYLDLMRFFAAIWVLLSHVAQFGAVNADAFPWLPESGRDAVVIFFVLSGFVIAYTCNERDKGPLNYISARAGRIYSVVIPVLLLTVVLDLVFMWLGSDKSFYPLYQYEKLYAYIPFHLLFGGEIWFLSEQPFTNPPYWSLGYEVWYYVLFGLFFYLKGWWKAVLLILLFAFIGYKLWILLPVWWAGVWLYNNIGKFTISKAFARLLFWGSIVAYLGFSYSPLQLYLIHFPSEFLGVEYASSPLGSAKKFLSDYVVCGLFVINVMAYRYSQYSLVKYDSIIKTAAGYTFVLYLAHAPIMKNIAAYFDYDKSSPLAFVVIMGVVLFIIRLLGYITEDQKHRYKAFFDFVLQRLLTVAREKFGLLLGGSSNK